MHTCYIECIRSGGIKPQVVRYRATSIAVAFARCLRAFPNATLLRGWIKGPDTGGGRITVYVAPSTARIVAEPGPKAEQTFFSFLKEISLSPEKRDRDAT